MLNAPAPSSTEAVLQTLAWAISKGFKPVPIRLGTKAALNRDYVKAGYDPSPAQWHSESLGIGVLLGRASAGLVDVDLDCPEAVFFAPRFLKATPAIFGRKSKPKSHYLYTIETALDKQAHLDVDGSTLVELRADGGHQTVFPGTVHPSGELVTWDGAPLPHVAEEKSESLVDRVKKIALACMIARHVWRPGFRNEPCKHLSGLFYHLGWTEPDAINFITAVMDYCGDDDKSRIPTIKLTFKRGAAGRRVTGSGVLRKQLQNDRLTDKIIELAGGTEAALIHGFNDRFAIVDYEGRFRIAKTDVEPGRSVVFYKKGDFIDLNARDKMQSASGKDFPKCVYWLNSPNARVYNGFDFAPGVDDDLPGRILNVWTGWHTPPGDGKCSAFLTMVRTVICSTDFEFKWLMNWCANIVREPSNKSGTCPVLVSAATGVGKTLFCSYLGEILGRAYVMVTQEEHFYGRFNAHTAGALLLHAEEAIFGGEKKHKGVVRSLISDRTRYIEHKGVDPKEVKNNVRVIITSNHMNAAPVDVNDRRYTIFEIPHERRAPDELYKEVVEEMNGSGPAALHKYLLEMDYDPAIPRLNIRNEALMAIKTTNLDPVDDWWYGVLLDGTLLSKDAAWCQRPEGVSWPEVVSIVALWTDMKIALKQSGTRRIPQHNDFATTLERVYFGKQIQRCRLNFSQPDFMDGVHPEICALPGRQRCYTVPDLRICRDLFKIHVGQDVNWECGEEDPPPKSKKPAREY